MKINKKIASIIAAPIALAVALFAGSGKKDDEPTQTASPQQTNGEIAPVKRNNKPLQTALNEMVKAMRKLTEARR